MDPKEMIDRMIEIVPADTGLFRRAEAIDDMLKKYQVGMPAGTAARSNRASGGLEPEQLCDPERA